MEDIIKKLKKLSIAELDSLSITELDSLSITELDSLQASIQSIIFDKNNEYRNKVNGGPTTYIEGIDTFATWYKQNI